MYQRAYQQNSTGKNHVTTFENPSAINQMARFSQQNQRNKDCEKHTPSFRNEQQVLSDEQTCQVNDNHYESRNESQKHDRKNNSLLNIGFLNHINLDDLLLIFLIILFLTDDNNQNDFMIPILLIIILLN